MPELPEVETIRRGLADALTGATITAVSVENPIQVIEHGAHFRDVTTQSIDRVWRRGKLLGIDLSGGLTLLVHLRMTGRLVLRSDTAPVPTHLRVSLTTTAGTLDLADPRTFARLTVLPTGDVARDPFLLRLGPEATHVDPEYLFARFSATRRCVKAVLLDQTVLAGVGNIYADEALFTAGVHPQQPANSLTVDEARRLSSAIGDVLATGIRSRGASLRDYVDASGQPGDFLAGAMVFARTDQPCRVCGTLIIKLRVAGRGTHLCPHCQPLI